MSLLAKVARDYLIARSGYAAALPGGIHPEQAPQGSAIPYMVTEGTNRTRELALDGTVAVSTESVQCTIVAGTRSASAVSADWVIAQIQATPARQTIGTTVVHHWRIEDQADSSESFTDGSDEQARITTLVITGTMEGG